MKRDWDSFVSIVPGVEDVFDDDAQGSQCAEGHANVSYQRVRHNVGDQETASRASDADAQVAEGIVEVVHGLPRKAHRHWNLRRVDLQPQLIGDI